MNTRHNVGRGGVVQRKYTLWLRRISYEFFNLKNKLREGDGLSKASRSGPFIAIYRLSPESVGFVKRDGYQTCIRTRKIVYLSISTDNRETLYFGE